MAVVQTSAQEVVPGSPNRSLGQYVNDYFRRVRGGDLGALPAVAGLVTLVAKVRIPSFVVTLAAFLAFQGVALLMLKNGTNISVDDPVISAIENKNLPVWLSWTLLAVVIVGYLMVQLLRVRSRRARG